MADTEKFDGKKFPQHIMRMLRKRASLDEKDTSHDAELEALSPRRALQQVIGWQIGDPTWADTFLGYAKDCGFRIEE